MIQHDTTINCHNITIHVASGCTPPQKSLLGRLGGSHRGGERRAARRQHPGGHLRGARRAVQLPEDRSTARSPDSAGGVCHRLQGAKLNWEVNWKSGRKNRFCWLILSFLEWKWDGEKKQERKADAEGI